MLIPILHLFMISQSLYCIVHEHKVIYIRLEDKIHPNGLFSKCLYSKVYNCISPQHYKEHSISTNLINVYGLV